MPILGGRASDGAGVEVEFFVGCLLISFQYNIFTASLEACWMHACGCACLRVGRGTLGRMLHVHETLRIWIRSSCARVCKHSRDNVRCFPILLTCTLGIPFKHCVRASRSRTVFFGLVKTFLPASLPYPLPYISLPGSSTTNIVKSYSSPIIRVSYHASSTFWGHATSQSASCPHNEWGTHRKPYVSYTVVGCRAVFETSAVAYATIPLNWSFNCPTKIPLDSIGNPLDSSDRPKSRAYPPLGKPPRNSIAP
jgi:hypothetical protein